MFLSETYIYRQEELDDTPYLNVSLNRPSLIEDEGNLLETKCISKSENNILLKTKAKNTKKSNGRLRKDVSQSFSYDADTDSDPEEYIEKVPVGLQNILQCEICHLEYTSCHEDRFNMMNINGSNSPTSPYTSSGDDKFKKKSFKKTLSQRRKEQSRRRNTTSSLNRINLEDYKDWAHKMEEFDPDAERVWTLQYNIDQKQQHKPKLSKIIIGRGHKNEFPELNNIHLFDEVKNYKETVWRNTLLSKCKEINQTIAEGYSLYPKNNTCLYCFEERASEITHALINGLPLHAKPPVRPTGKELNLPTKKLQHSSGEVKKNTFKFSSLFKKKDQVSVGKKINQYKVNVDRNNDDDDDDEEFTVL